MLVKDGWACCCRGASNGKRDRVVCDRVRQGGEEKMRERDITVALLGVV